MSGSFVKRTISVQLVKSGVTTTFTGLRMSVSIDETSSISATAELRIFGMTNAQMVQFARVQSAHYGTVVNETSIIITAGENGFEHICYMGKIISAQPDFGGMPDVAFHVICLVGLDLSLLPTAPLSYPQPIDVATIMQTLAASAQYTFENTSNVSVMLQNAYFPGTWRDQFNRARDAADINAFVDYRTLAIWPKGQARMIPIVQLSPSTGLVGYPSWSDTGITLRCLFNPLIRLGSTIDLDPEDTTPEGLLINCRGKWITGHLAHTLECETPGGAWFTDITVAAAYQH